MVLMTASREKLRIFKKNNAKFAAIDIHTHPAVTATSSSFISKKYLNKLDFRILFALYRINKRQTQEQLDAQLKSKYFRDVAEAVASGLLNFTVALAFDGVYDAFGTLDKELTHYYISNDFIFALADENEHVLAGVSIHPFRKDALSELERAYQRGTVLVKWLPLTQLIYFEHPKTLEFLKLMSELKLPLLVHTGSEQTLGVNDKNLENPEILKPALDAGVTVIAAHCASGKINEPYFKKLKKMLGEYPNLYADTAALNSPVRGLIVEHILKSTIWRDRLLHGSDYPIPVFPGFSGLLTAETVIRAMQLKSMLARDAFIKRELGFTDSYFARFHEILDKNV